MSVLHFRISQMVNLSEPGRARLKKTLSSTSDLFRDANIYRAAIDLFGDTSEPKKDQFTDSRKSIV